MPGDATAIDRIDTDADHTPNCSLDPSPEGGGEDFAALVALDLGEYYIVGILSAAPEGGRPSAAPAAPMTRGLPANGQADASSADGLETVHLAAFRPDPPARLVERCGPVEIGVSPDRDGSHDRIRLDHVDTGGKISLRRAGRMPTSASAPTTARQPSSSSPANTVTHRTTGEVLSEHTIDPTRVYWRNKQKEPGRWPDSQQ